MRVEEGKMELVEKDRGLIELVEMLLVLSCLVGSSTATAAQLTRYNCAPVMCSFDDETGCDR